MTHRPSRPVLIRWFAFSSLLAFAALAVSALLFEPGENLLAAFPVVRASEETRTPDSVTHTVEEGDTLYALARRYYGAGRLWPEIERANPGRAVAHLQVGDRLRIPILPREVIRRALPRPRRAPTGEKTSELLERIALTRRVLAFREWTLPGPGADVRYFLAASQAPAGDQRVDVFRFDGARYGWIARSVARLGERYEQNVIQRQPTPRAPATAVVVLWSREDGAARAERLDIQGSRVRASSMKLDREPRMLWASTAWNPTESADSTALRGTSAVTAGPPVKTVALSTGPAATPLDTPRPSPPAPAPDRQ